MALAQLDRPPLATRIRVIASSFLVPANQEGDRHKLLCGKGFGRVDADESPDYVLAMPQGKLCIKEAIAEVVYEDLFEECFGPASGWTRLARRQERFLSLAQYDYVLRTSGTETCLDRATNVSLVWDGEQLYVGMADYEKRAWNVDMVPFLGDFPPGVPAPRGTRCFWRG
ncbi:MAG TPA: hypothetical protein VGP13_03715 [Candidatus Paceibacterota bacterium]|jgi:hypothetical protein|nr:hypothetical protein [Candidatus Paceibacterota bacterium]